MGTNLKKFLECKGIHCVIWDKVDGNNVEDLVMVSTDVVVHLAALPSVAKCQKDVKSAVYDNILSTIRLFHLAIGKEVIFASSGAATQPLANFYAACKFIAEEEAFRLNKLGPCIKVMRFSNVYGGEKYVGYKTSVVAKFIDVKLKREPIIINGDGSQKRDFIHVDDVCEAIYLGLINMNKKLYESPIEIGSGKKTSILELAKMFDCEYIFDKKSDMVGVKEASADTELAEKLLGFKAKKKIEDYIKSLCFL